MNYSEVWFSVSHRTVCVFLGFLFFDKDNTHVSVPYTYTYTRVIAIGTEVIQLEMTFNLLPWGDVKHIFDIVSCNKLTLLGF